MHFLSESNGLFVSKIKARIIQGLQNLRYFFQIRIGNAFRDFLGHALYLPQRIQISVLECEELLGHTGTAWRMFRNQIHVNVYVEAAPETGSVLQYQLVAQGWIGAICLSLAHRDLALKIKAHSRRLLWLAMYNTARADFDLVAFEHANPGLITERFIALRESKSSWQSPKNPFTILKGRIQKTTGILVATSGIKRPVVWRNRRVLVLQWLIDDNLLQQMLIPPFHGHPTKSRPGLVPLELSVGLAAGIVASDGLAEYPADQEKCIEMQLSLSVDCLLKSRLFKNAQLVLWQDCIPIKDLKLPGLRAPYSCALTFETDHIRLSGGDASRHLLGGAEFKPQGSLHRGDTLPALLQGQQDLFTMQSTSMDILLTPRSLEYDLNRVYHLAWRQFGDHPLEQFISSIARLPELPPLHQAMLVASVDWHYQKQDSLDLNDFHYRPQPAHSSWPG